MFFPPVTETAPEETRSKDAAIAEKAEAKEEAEAKAVAEELPSAPTGEPSTGHVGKKQKQDDA